MMSFYYLTDTQHEKLDNISGRYDIPTLSRDD
jgi:hypothetical protein